MATFNPHHETTALYAEIERFKDACLLCNGSILSPNAVLWTSENLAELHQHFVENIDEGSGSYYDKLQQQISTAVPDARKLMAELHWFLLLFSSNTKAETKEQGIRKIWSWSGESLADAVPALSSTVLGGIGHTGTAYNTHRWRELSFLIGTLQTWKALTPKRRQELLDEPRDFANFLDAVDGVEGRQLRHILPHLLFPESFERISVPSHKRGILEGFGRATREDAKKMAAAELDKALLSLREHLAKTEGGDFDFYQDDIRHRWQNIQPISEGAQSFDRETSAEKIQLNPQNIILYGPPGTGKTYETAREAVRLCGEQLPEDRHALMDIYRRLQASGRIEFITFHQSMAYEEFIEGLRPDTSVEGGEDAASTGFRLQPEPGLFRRIAKRAETSRGQPSPEDVVQLAGRQIFKMSIGEANNPDDGHLFEDAIAGGYTILGFEDIDWADDKYASRDAIIEACKECGDHNADVDARSGVVQMPFIFRNQVREGDILVVSKGNLEFRAIGEVVGDYEFHPRPEGGYAHRRAVRWLWIDREGVPFDEINGRKFSQKSIYSLSASEMNIAALERYMNSQRTDGQDDPEPFVLIIDEINRANISKVFGEFITLLEPDKRLGQSNALKVRLPYSGDEFGVPSNLHILGTMNTADRSIALLDTALRRRFMFREMMPQPELLSEAAERAGIDLPRLLETINERIEYLFDRERQIGHAYFMGCTSGEEVDAVMRLKVIPLLAEYFFEDWSKVAAVLGDLEEHDKAIKGGFLERSILNAPQGFNDDAAPRFRWKVRDAGTGFDYSRLLPL